MPLDTVPVARRDGIKVVPESYPELNQRDRIIEAIGPLRDHLVINERTLSRYYTYLMARLSFPFTAFYPEPTITLEEVRHRCAVVDLLDPANDIYDKFGGIFCKIRSEKYEINLPLIELEIPQGSPNFQFIEDYWYWFWNWR